MNKHEEHDAKNISCYKCNIPEDSATLNYRKDSTLVVVRSILEPPFNFQGYEFCSVICFNCKNLTLIAIDPKKPNFYRYVEINKATEADIHIAKVTVNELGENEVTKKLDSFKL